MSYKPQAFDDQPVTRSRRMRLWEEETEAGFPAESLDRKKSVDDELAREEISKAAPPTRVGPEKEKPAYLSAGRWPILKRGHTLSFLGLLLFTATLYFRPYEFISSLAGFRSMAFWLAVATLVVFLPTQLAVEGTLSVLPREVKLVLLLCLLGLLSVPFAIEPGEAWPAFLDYAKVVTMFVVMVNVVRTEGRLRKIIWLALLVSLVLSANALNDYRTGNLKLGGNRILGVISGLFDNPNDLALHLVTMIPLALGLLWAARALSGKLIYGLCALLMTAATVVTFSRGGFLALACASFTLAWKLGRRNRLAVVLLFLFMGIMFFALVPHDYTGRLLSSFGGDLDGGSAGARQNLLLKSIIVTATRPLLGIGMNNFHILSIHEQVTHNAYTQVGSEMGVPAMLIYIMFMLFSLKRLRQIERETLETRKQTRIYYLSVALQASLIGYMVASFFASVAYLWYVYYLVGYALCLHRLYEAKGAHGVFARRKWSSQTSIAEASGKPAPSAARVLSEPLV
ncbi:MAG TPA: O-antigen ligase family protein [Pyrinomonadaceae bacterium]